MTQTAHTPGKLAVGDQNGHGGIDIYPLDRRHITTATVYLNLVTSAKSWGEEHFALPENAESVATANRFVALWNACIGIPDPSVVPEAIEALRAIQKTMDGYRSQMKFCDVEALGHFREFDRRVDASGFRAILSKLEGRS